MWVPEYLERNTVADEVLSSIHSLAFGTLVACRQMWRKYRPTVKAGYPPHNLTLIPELPLDSLGLKQGEQIIVTKSSQAQSSDATATSNTFQTQVPTTTSSAAAPAPMTGLTGSQVYDSSPFPAPTASSGGPDYVETDGGYLIHRVRPSTGTMLFSLPTTIHADSTGR